MKKTFTTLAIAGFALPFAIACASDGSSGTSTTAANGTTSRAPGASAPAAGSTTTASTGAPSGTTASTGAAGGTTASAPSAPAAGSNTATRAPSGAPSIPSLVTVDLRNVLNNLAVKLNIDRANVPVTAQLPIQLAANVCGVSVNVLSVSTGGQANCTAKTAPQELTQAVQQQMAAGGSVGGGAQSNTTGAPGAATGGAANTSATSSGQAAPATTTTPPRT
jgi:hypothetical protein